jgi:hypothetical protein
VSVAFVVGYDPGRNGSHGLATLRVEAKDGRWKPMDLAVSTAADLHGAVGWVEETCRGGRIVAAGVYTLTEWNGGRAGWRPADRWLKIHYPAVGPSIKSPNALRGSMTVNGAAFLLLLAERFQADGTVVTEAHPKVCYHALTGEKPDWSVRREEMAAWLVAELGAGTPDEICQAEDHRFDAAIAALAAFRGLSGEWTLDLHGLPGADPEQRVQLAGPTHYWWPPDASRRR